jgi:2-keto-4-pentenoate hydratase/2-oxohepta-3-ene-1,7-dioic acid hydratase in catechol pathway
MRYARVALGDARWWARVDGDRLVVIDAAPWAAPAETGEVVALAGAHLLAPVEPTKIVAIGSNYAKHAAEMGKAVPSIPKIFFKPTTALIGPGEVIRIPPGTTRVDPEGELGVVVGRRLCRATPDEARAAVFGYTACNDVTCRDFQAADGVFARAKGFDTFCPTGPFLDTDLDPADCPLSTVVNGETRASGNTHEMVFDVATLLSFVSQIMTLLPGDLLSTGTPPGVAPIVAGDVVEVRLGGMVLRNPVDNRDDRTD